LAKNSESLSVKSNGNGLSQETSADLNQQNLRLVPIDHGLSIPDTLIVHSYDLVWLGYSQAEEAFSEEALAYIRAIDTMRDIGLLERTFKFRSQCLRNLRISQTLLKKGA